MRYQTVYGVLMNHPSEFEALGDALNVAPYGKPPVAPVVYIKPSNTHYPAAKALRYLEISYTDPDLPADQAQRLRLRPCLGLVFKRAFARGTTQFSAADFEVGFFLDFTYPHNSFYRPPIRFNAMDNSLVTPTDTVSLQAIGGWETLTQLELLATLKSELFEYKVADFVRQPQALLESVSEFIAFEGGDVLLLGSPAPMAELANPGALLSFGCSPFSDAPKVVPSILACVFDLPTREYKAMVKAQADLRRNERRAAPDAQKPQGSAA